MMKAQTQVQPMFYTVTEVGVMLGLEYEMARRQMKEFEKMGITVKIGRQTKVYRQSFHELFSPKPLKEKAKPLDGWKMVKGGRK